MKLPDYKKIAAGVERKKVFVEEKEIDSTLKWLQQSRAKFTLKNQPAQRGDFLEIEYSIIKEKEGVNKQGAKFPAEKPGELSSLDKKDAFILGQGYFLPGFEENLVGMKAGEKKENIVLKKNGKNIKVKVEIRSVQNIELPEIGDELARNLGEFENLNGLKKNIKEGLILEKEQTESLRWRNEVLEKISQTTECEIPEALIEEEKKQMLENFQNWVKENLKISFGEYLDRVKKTEKEILDFFSIQAKKKVKNLLILREIGKKEGLDLDDLKKYNTEEAKIEKIFQVIESFTKT